jgi:hypothetical protein
MKIQVLRTPIQSPKQRRNLLRRRLVHLWRCADVSYGVVAISFDTGLVAGFIIASRCDIAFRGKDSPSDPHVLV